jgi:arsenite methyltransferase
MTVNRAHNHKELRFSTVGKIRPAVAIFLFLATIFLGALTPGCVQMETLSYDGFYRSGWQHPARVIRSLRIRKGDVIANVGSKTDYFTFYLARAVGPKGKVYSVSNDRKLNKYVEKRAKKEGFKNIEVIRAEALKPEVFNPETSRRKGNRLLPEKGIDLIFSCNVYPDIKQPKAYFSNAREYLRPKGLVAILAFHPNQGWYAKLGDPTVPDKVVRQDLAAAGYTLEKEFDYLPRQLFLVFSPKSR